MYIIYKKDTINSIYYYSIDVSVSHIQSEKSDTVIM